MTRAYNNQCLIGRLDEGQKGLKRDNDVDFIKILPARIISRHYISHNKNFIKIDDAVLKCLPNIISILTGDSFLQYLSLELGIT